MTFVTNAQMIPVLSKLEARGVLSNFPTRFEMMPMVPLLLSLFLHQVLTLYIFSFLEMESAGETSWRSTGPAKTQAMFGRSSMGVTLSP